MCIFVARARVCVCVIFFLSQTRLWPFRVCVYYINFGDGTCIIESSFYLSVCASLSLNHVIINRRVDQGFHKNMQSYSEKIVPKNVPNSIQHILSISWILLELLYSRIYSLLHFYQLPCIVSVFTSNISRHFICPSRVLGQVVFRWIIWKSICMACLFSLYIS
jgi:hypothetical protein